MHFLLLSTLVIFFVPCVFADINSTSLVPPTSIAEQISAPKNTIPEIKDQTTVVAPLTPLEQVFSEIPLEQPAQISVAQQSGQNIEHLLKQLDSLRLELNDVKKQLQTTSPTNNAWQFRESLRISEKEIVIDNTILAILIAVFSLLIALFATLVAQRAKNKAVYQAKESAERHFLIWLEKKESETVKNIVQKTTAMNKNHGQKYLAHLEERLFTAQKAAKDLGHLSDLYLSITAQYEDDIRDRLAHFDLPCAADDLKKFTYHVNNRLVHKTEAYYSPTDSFDKAILLFHQQAYRAANLFLDNVITHPGSDHLLVTNALFNKAYSLQKCQQATDAISVYDQVILRVAENEPIELQQQVIKSMSHKGFLLQQLNLVDQEIALYEQIIARFSDFTELSFEVQVNLAIMHKTLTLVEQRTSSEVMPLYNDLIARLGERVELEIQQIVAQVLVHKSTYLTTLGQQPEALACYESVVARFAASQDLILQTLVAQSLERLLDLYAIQEKPLAIIELCDKIHFRFSRGKTLRFKQLMARSLATKANILLKFNKTKETVRFFDEIVARYKQSTDPSLQTAVNNALTNVALISLICEDMTSSKLRIQQAEKANQATSLNFVAIQFIRFLIDDISIENFIDKAEKLAENTTFDRSFATLDGFIKRLPATKNRQVNAALDFFENHHDINKFRKEISH